jgi:hypothetical protein
MPRTRAQIMSNFYGLHFKSNADLIVDKYTYVYEDIF